MASMYGQNAVTYFGTTRQPKLGALPQQNQRQRRERGQTRPNLNRTSTHSQSRSSMNSKHGRVLSAIPQQQLASHRGVSFVRTRESGVSPVSVIGATALPLSVQCNMQGSKGAITDLSQLTSFSSDWGGSGGSLPSEWQRCSNGQSVDPPLGQEALSQVSQASSTSSTISPFQQFQMEQREGAQQKMQQQQHQKNRQSVHKARETPVVHTQMLPPAPVSFKDYVHLNPHHNFQQGGSTFFRPDPPHQLAGKSMSVRGLVNMGRCVAALRQRELHSQDLSQSSKTTQTSAIGLAHSTMQNLYSNSHPHSLELPRATRTTLNQTSGIDAVEAQVNALVAEKLDKIKNVWLEQKAAADAFAEQVADATKQIDLKTNCFMLQAADFEKKQEETTKHIDQQVTTIASVFETVKSFMKYWTTSSFATVSSGTSTLSSLSTPTKESHVSPERPLTPTSTQNQSLKKPTTSKAPHHRSTSKRPFAGGDATSVRATSFTSKSHLDTTGAKSSALSSITNASKKTVPSESATGSRSRKTSGRSTPSLQKMQERCVNKKSSKSKQSTELRNSSKTVTLPRALLSCVTPCKKITNPFKIHGEIGDAPTAAMSKKHSFGCIAQNSRASKRIRVKLSMPSQIFFDDDEHDGFL